MWECKLVKVLIPTSVNLFVDQCPMTQEKVEDVSHVSCASVVRNQLYQIDCTRPSIAHALRFLSRHMLKLRKKQYWIVVKRVFEYLHATLDYVICYQGRPGPCKEIDI
jgi:hypothetical protein